MNILLYTGDINRLLCLFGCTIIDQFWNDHFERPDGAFMIMTIVRDRSRHFAISTAGLFPSRMREEEY